MHQTEFDENICRALFLSVGTRGDVEPLCAAANELLLHSSLATIDFFVQKNHTSIVRPLQAFHRLRQQQQQSDATSNSSSVPSSSLLRVHEFPFTSRSYYDVPKVSRELLLQKLRKQALTKTERQEGSKRPYTASSILNDPRMTSVSDLADIIVGLVLPSLEQVEVILRKQKCNIIVTTALARPLAFLLAKRQQLLHHKPIHVFVIHLQPLAPNPQFPSYRVSVPIFVQSIMAVQRLNDQNEDGGMYDTECASFDIAEIEETYWRIEYALEMLFLRDQIENCSQRQSSTVDQVQQIQENDSAVQHDDISEYFTWDELKEILLGHNDNITIVNAYSNYLVPKLDHLGHNLVDIGPLADSYILPGSPSSSLSQFLLRHTDTKTDSSDRKGPICIGFGSMVFPKSTRLLIDALFELKCPAVLVGSCLSDCKTVTTNTTTTTSSTTTAHGLHANTKNRPGSDFDCDDQKYEIFVRDKIYHLNSIPYNYLLPYCSLMVCHGGAGVVNSCLRAGVPCLVAPVLGDQFAWAALLQAKGVGIQISNCLNEITKDDLVASIRAVLNPSPRTSSSLSIAEKARELGKKIRSNDKEIGAKLLATLIQDKVTS